MVPECLNDFPNLSAYKRRFEAIPTIRAYMQSEQYLVRVLGCPWCRVPQAKPCCVVPHGQASAGGGSYAQAYAHASHGAPSYNRCDHRTLAALVLAGPAL